MMITDFIKRGRAKVWPLFTFVEPLSTNAAKPLKRRGADWPSREPRSANGSLAAEIGQGQSRAVERPCSTEYGKERSDAQRFQMSDTVSDISNVRHSECLTSEGQGAAGDAEPVLWMPLRHQKRAENPQT